jgi:Undecaprenyl-phosphate glucose phosphotransferase
MPKTSIKPLQKLSLSRSVLSEQENLKSLTAIEADNARFLVFFAMLEFMVALSSLYGTSLIYHLFVLGLPFNFFDNRLYAVFSIGVSVFYSLIAFNSNAYILGQARQNVKRIRRLIYAWMAAFGLALLFAFFFQYSEDLSRIAVIVSFAVGLLALLIIRVLVFRYTEKQVAAGRLRFQRAIVIGSRDNVVSYLYKKQLWRKGFSLVGALYLEDLNIPGTNANAFLANIHTMRPDSILMVGDWSDFTRHKKLMKRLVSVPANLCFVSISQELAHMKLGITRIGNQSVVTLAGRPLSLKQLCLKRGFDIVFSACALAALSPFFALAAILIKLDSPGPVFYKQNRQGFNGDVFAIWKFRSMRVTENDQQFRQAQKNDPRITRIGAFLRKTNLDELPQFINVLNGTMSVVGPRPHAILHNSQFEEKVAEYARRHHVKPGITGWAQVNGYRGETRTTEQMEARVRHDLHYMESWSLTFDIWIILMTVFSVRSYNNAG